MVSDRLTDSRTHVLALPESGAVAEALRALVSEAPDRVASVQLVGGPVRDLLLGLPVADAVDLDVVVEGDAIALCRALTAAHGGAVAEHGRFGTATWTPDPSGLHIDLVTARREVYAAPGALPDVSASGLADDLARRDFTVHSMALRLWPKRELIDPHGGQADLAAGLLRVHHDRSFLDDPTRLLRAARYATRFGLELEPGTAKLFAEALAGGALRSVSADRLRQEWRRCLAEKDPAGILAWMDEHGLAEALGLRSDPALLRALPALRELGPEDLELGSLALLAAPDTLLGLPEGPAARLRALVALEPAPFRGAPSGHELEAALPRDPLAPILLVARFPELAGPVRQAQGLRATPPLLRGSDLLDAGLPPGPAVGEALRRLRAAQHRGEVGDAEEALAWLRSSQLLP